MNLARILGFGAFAPEQVVTNDDLAKRVDTSDEWIYSHTGIKRRHIAKDDEITSDLAVEAAKKALEDSGLNAEDIDGIIVATVTPDYNGFPSTACIVQEKLNMPEAWAFDIVAGCTGFAYGLKIASDMVKGGSGKVLLVGAEKLSAIANWEDRNTCVLFGDGAGAVVLGVSDDDSGVIDSILRAKGSGAQALKRHSGGVQNPLKIGDVVDSEIFLSMDGRAVYNFAVGANVEIINELLERNNLTIDDIAYIVPHQANVRIIQAAAKRLKFPIEKFFMNMEEYANTSGASIPLALGDLNSRRKLNKGEYIITVGFGAGLTYGGNLIKL